MHSNCWVERWRAVIRSTNNQIIFRKNLLIQSFRHAQRAKLRLNRKATSNIACKNRTIFNSLNKTNSKGLFVSRKLYSNMVISGFICSSEWDIWETYPYDYRIASEHRDGCGFSLREADWHGTRQSSSSVWGIRKIWLAGNGPQDMSWII